MIDSSCSKLNLLHINFGLSTGLCNKNNSLYFCASEPVSVCPGTSFVLHKCSLTWYSAPSGWWIAGRWGREVQPVLNVSANISSRKQKPWVKKQTRQWEDADRRHPLSSSAFIRHETTAEVLRSSQSLFVDAKFNPLITSCSAFVRKIPCDQTRVERRRQPLMGSFLLVLYLCASDVFKYSYE